MNLLLSHPDVVAPHGELHHVFKGGALNEKKMSGFYKKIFYDLPLKLMSGKDIFRRVSFWPRKIPNEIVLTYIDWILYREKQKATDESYNLWKNPANKYTKDEIADSRLTFKAHDGLVFCNDIFRKMYPDARFVAIVRNGFAVCEGHIRRGYSVEKAAMRFTKTGEEIARNFSNPDYLCIKFEDILTEPLKSIQSIYIHCGLDINKCQYFRLQHKATVSANGKSILKGDYDRQLEWYTPDEINRYFVSDVNKNQISRLTADEINYLTKAIGPTMQKLNYL